MKQGANWANAAGRGKSLVLLAVVVVIGGILLLSDVKVSLGEEDFTVGCFMAGEKQTAYSDIQYLEYRDSLDFGSRAMGLGTMKLQAGAYQNAEFGAYTLYAYTGVNGYIVIHGDDGTVLAFNQPTEAETKEIYDQIYTRWESIMVSATLRP